MASRGCSTLWLRLIVTAAAVSIWWQPATSDPQINELGKGCNSVFAKNKIEFVNNLNDAFSQLRGKLPEERFATVQVQPANTEDPVFAMAQCRKYMSVADCLTCYDAAVDETRNCGNATTGARAIYDGCILRYNANNFFTKSNDNALSCGNTNTPAAFREEGLPLLRDLQLATPKIEGYYAAAKKEIPNAYNLTIYAVAQCVETITEDGCRGCMNGAYETIKDCLFYADGRLTDAGCFMRFSSTPFFADDQTADIGPFLRDDSNKNRAVIGGVGGGAGLAIIVVALVLWYIFSRKLKIATRGNILGATELQRPNRYSYRELEAATNNFSEENKLGEGAFGVVYKATLRNGNILAVKKLDTSYSRAKADFESESRLISNVHHRNLIRLLGCCSKGLQLLLVYEYMENGSLDRFLYGDKRGSLNWKQRFDIIFGTARGIAYLHEHYHTTIIHRDIKPSNILLDNEFQAKIADFGLARLHPENQTHVTTKFAGTFGYTAPEYAIKGHLSEKVDVYSFGIVMLEIISGRRCNDMNEDSETGYLLGKAWKLYENGDHHTLADEAMNSDEYETEGLKKMVEIALVCTQSPPSSRPSMSEVFVMILSDGSVERMAPMRRPSLNYGRRGLGENPSISNGSSASNATVSISHYTGR